MNTIMRAALAALIVSLAVGRVVREQKRTIETTQAEIEHRAVYNQAVQSGGMAMMKGVVEGYAKKLAVKFAKDMKAIETCPAIAAIEACKKDC